MQKAIIVRAAIIAYNGTSELNKLLGEGYKVVMTEVFHPSESGGRECYPGDVLVIVEK
jgi:hypothetical protein